MNRLLIFVCALLGFAFVQIPTDAYADSACHGRFVDPITGPCWDCMLPISLGGATVFNGSRPDPSNPISPICFCGTPIPRVGLEWGFWEPARMADVTQHPFCFVNLGGVQLNIPIVKKKAQVSTTEQGDRTSYHVHYYVYPLLYWLNVLTDLACLQSETFDVAYITEFDPLWNDDEIAAIINPEVFIFSNPIATLACAADCVAATTGLPMQGMFWCAGCQGNLYPMSGQVTGEYGPLPGALQVTDRFLAKMHREFLAQGTRGNASICNPVPQPIMDKLQYRIQEVYPVYHKSKTACAPLGRSTVLYENGKVIPVTGEDLGFIIFRKRNCCAF